MAHTTLSIDKIIYNKSLKRAKKDYLTVSTVAKLLLKAYSEGKINILALQVDEPVEIRELQDHEITPELRRMADEARNKPLSEFINIPI